MKQNFKKGLAVVLSILTVIAVIARYVDQLNAMGETLDGLMAIAIAILTIIVALPLWLLAITAWHKLHHSSYVAFKNWCIKTSNEVVND